MFDVLALISSGTVSSGSDSFLVSPSDSCKDGLNNEMLFVNEVMTRDPPHIVSSVFQLSNTTFTSFC